VVVLAFIILLGLGVHNKGFDDWINLLAIHLNVLLDMHALEGLVALLMTLDARHISSSLKLLHHVVMVVLREVDIIHGVTTL